MIKSGELHMNIAVINIKDIFKYLIKLGVILFILTICIQIFKVSKQDRLKQEIINKASEINDFSFLSCLDLSISLMSYTKETQSEEKFLTTNKILSMGTGILDDAILANTDLVINKEEMGPDDVEELENQVAELPDDVTVESVEENNIKAKYTTSYGSVKINNQSDFELKEEMMKPDIDFTNKKDILIYHTHTCESYTASKRI